MLVRWPWDMEPPYIMLNMFSKVMWSPSIAPCFGRFFTFETVIESALFEKSYELNCIRLAIVSISLKT